jgi:hypothetical protein
MPEPSPPVAACAPAASPDPGRPPLESSIETPARHWKRFTATMIGVIACWGLAMFWSSGKYTGAAIGAIAGMVIAFVGGDSASKFAGSRPPGPPRRLL